MGAEVRFVFSPFDANATLWAQGGRDAEYCEDASPREEARTRPSLGTLSFIASSGTLAACAVFLPFKFQVTFSYIFHFSFCFSDK